MRIAKIEIAGANMDSTGLPRAMAELTRTGMETIVAIVDTPNGRSDALAISLGSDTEHLKQRIAVTVKLARILDGNEDNVDRMQDIIEALREASEA